MDVLRAQHRTYYLMDNCVGVEQLRGHRGLSSFSSPLPPLEPEGKQTYLKFHLVSSFPPGQVKSRCRLLWTGQGG